MRSDYIDTHRYRLKKKIGIVCAFQTYLEYNISKQNTPSVRLAGGSLFYSEDTCHGTIKERELYVDQETANIHIGFSVIELQ